MALLNFRGRGEQRPNRADWDLRDLTVSLMSDWPAVLPVYRNYRLVPVLSAPERTDRGSPTRPGLLFGVQGLRLRS